MSELKDKIRRALNVTGHEAERLEVVYARIAEARCNLVPERARQSRAQLLATFIEMLEAAEATIAHVDGLDDVANEIARYVLVNDLGERIRFGSDPIFTEIDWAGQSDLEMIQGPAAPTDEISLTHAIAGAAETGTLFVASGPENPVTLSFLPETNIVLIKLLDITGSYEEAWPRFFSVDGRNQLPRTINLISGPSRTADIEQKLITGAHGPRRLHVIIVG